MISRMTSISLVMSSSLETLPSSRGGDLKMRWKGGSHHHLVGETSLGRVLLDLVGLFEGRAHPRFRGIGSFCYGASREDRILLRGVIECGLARWGAGDRERGLYRGGEEIRWVMKIR